MTVQVTVQVAGKGSYSATSKGERNLILAYHCNSKSQGTFLSQIKVLDDGFSTKSGAISLKKLQKGPKTVRTSSELKKMEQEYQEERGELKLKVQKREKGETKEEKKARKQEKVKKYFWRKWRYLASIRLYQSFRMFPSNPYCLNRRTLLMDHSLCSI